MYMHISGLIVGLEYLSLPYSGLFTWDVTFTDVFNLS